MASHPPAAALPARVQAMQAQSGAGSTLASMPPAPSPLPPLPHPHSHADATAATATAAAPSAQSWLSDAPARRLRIFHSLSWPSCSLFSSCATPSLRVSDFDLDAVVLAAGGGVAGVEAALALLRELDAEGLRLECMEQLNLVIALRFQTRHAIDMLAQALDSPQPSPLAPLARACGSSRAELAQAVSRLLESGMGGVDPALPLSDVLRALAKQAPSGSSGGGGSSSTSATAEWGTGPEALTKLAAATAATAASMRRRVLGRHLASSPAAAALLAPPSPNGTAASTPPPLRAHDLDRLLRACRDSLFWTFRHLNLLSSSAPLPPPAERSVDALVRRLESMHTQATGLPPLPPLPPPPLAAALPALASTVSSAASLPSTTTPNSASGATGTPSPRGLVSGMAHLSVTPSSAASGLTPSPHHAPSPSIAWPSPRSAPPPAESPHSNATPAAAGAMQQHSVPSSGEVAFVPSATGAVPAQEIFIPSEMPAARAPSSPKSAGAVSASTTATAATHPPRGTSRGFSLSSIPALFSSSLAALTPLAPLMPPPPPLKPAPAPVSMGEETRAAAANRAVAPSATAASVPAPTQTLNTPAAAAVASISPPPPAAALAPSPPQRAAPVQARPAPGAVAFSLAAAPPPLSSSPPSSVSPSSVVSPPSALPPAHNAHFFPSHPGAPHAHNAPLPSSHPTRGAAAVSSPRSAGAAIVANQPPAHPTPSPRGNVGAFPQQQSQQLLQPQSISPPTALPALPTPTSGGAPSPSSSSSDRQRADRAVVLAALSYPRCQLFLGAPALRVTDRDLDQLLSEAGHVDACVSLLRGLDRSGVRLRSVAELHTRFRAAALDSRREELVQYLVYPRCTLFTRCTRPIEIDDEDLDRLMDAAGGLKAAVEWITRFEREQRKFWSFAEMMLAVEIEREATMAAPTAAMTPTHAAAVTATAAAPPPGHFRAPSVQVHMSPPPPSSTLISPHSHSHSLSYSSDAGFHLPGGTGTTASSTGGSGGRLSPTSSAAAADAHARMFPLLSRALQGVEDDRAPPSARPMAGEWEAAALLSSHRSGSLSHYHSSMQFAAHSGGSVGGFGSEQPSPAMSAQRWSSPEISGPVAASYASPSTQPAASPLASHLHYARAR